MNHNTKNTRFLRPLSLAFMSCVFALTLSSCSNNEDKYSSINGDNTYLTLGDKYSVTNKELYNQLKWSSSTYLSNQLNSTIVKEELEEVKAAVESSNENTEKYRNKVQMALICDVYGLSAYSDYTGLNNPYNKKTKEKEFITKTSVNNKVGAITEADLNTLLSRKSTTNNDEDKYDEDKGTYDFDYSKLSSAQKTLLAQYYETVAQELYAKKVLNKEIADHDADLDDDEERYFSNSEIINYWSSNYHYASNIDAIMIRFMNEDESKAVLKSFGLKTYRSQLYFIAQREGETDSEYSKFYDDYDFTAPNTLRSATPLASSPQLVFSIYLQMYNYIYTTRESLPVNSTITSDNSNCRKITANLVNTYGTVDLSGKYYALDYINILKENNPDLYEKLTYNKESLDKINSSLSTYLYDTLKSVTYKEENGERIDTTKDNYSTSAQSYGDFYYMAYKISQEDDSQKLYYTSNQENEIYYVEEVDGTYKVYKYKGSSKIEVQDDELKDRDENHPLLTNEGKKNYYELLNEIYDGLKKETLTSSYISTCMTNAKKNVKVRIYDKDIEIAYMAANSDYSKNRKSGAANLVATFKYEDEDSTDETRSWEKSVNMIDIWNNLEPTSGISSAVSLLSTQVIKSTSTYDKIKNDKEKTDTYYQSLNNLLSNFAADQLSSSGYSASLGKYNFLMLYFHTNNMTDIINDYYCVNEASTSLINDYANSDLAGILAKFANTYYDSYFSVSGKNLLVYVDMDEDGEPDRTETGLSYVDSDFDWNQVDPNSGQTYNDLAKELINKIITLCDNSSNSNVDTISSIITEYNSSSRFTNGHDKYEGDDEYNPTEPESEWAKYRRAGIFLKTEDLSVSNTSDYASCNDVLKLAAYKAYQENFLFNGKDGVMPNEYLLREYYGQTGKGLYSSFGYNLPLLTSATTKASAKYEEDENNGDLYNNLVYKYNDEYYKISNIFNSDDKISINQALSFMLDYAANGSSSTLPTDVTTALTTYFQPAFTRYTSDSTQFEVLVTWMTKETGYTLTENDDIYKYYGFGNSSSNYDFYKTDSDGNSVFQCYNNKTTFQALLDSNHESTDSYLSTVNVYSSDSKLSFFGEENADEYVKQYFTLLNQYDGWWTQMKSYIIENVKVSNKEGK